MRKKAPLILCVVCLILSVALILFAVLRNPEREDGDPSAVDVSSGTGSPGETSETAWTGMQNDRLNAFDQAMVRYLCGNGYYSSNFAVSPVSFRASLCLAAAGAGGDTRAELLSAAGFSDMAELNLWYKLFQDASARYSTAPAGSFYAAGSVWSNLDLLGAFSGSYRSRVGAQYGADVCAYGDRELTEKVNEWVGNKTGGTIPYVTGDLSGASSVLANAFSMRTLWRSGFAASATHQRVFTDASGGEKTMAFMEQTGEFLYAEENGTKILVLPMRDDLSFVCFLGNRTEMFDKLSSLGTEKVHVVLPKFELRTDLGERDLLNFLVSRGVRDAIDEKNASFDGMGEDLRWFLHVPIGTAAIAVEETGTVTNGERPDGGTETKEFIADRPFSFAVFSDFGLGDQQMLLYGQMMTAGE